MGYFSKLYKTYLLFFYIFASNKNVNRMKREYITPKELIKINKVESRFKNFRNIGYFIMNFPDKISFYRTSKSILIDKNSFLEFLDFIELHKNQ